MKTTTLRHDFGTAFEALKTEYTYKELVAKTGLEQTRLFRIFNGAPVRIDELEKLEASELLSVSINGQKRPAKSSKQMTGADFQELLRVANCLSESDFKTMFTPDENYYWSKFNIKGTLSFISYLDSDNARIFYEYCYAKMIKQREA